MLTQTEQYTIMELIERSTGQSPLHPDNKEPLEVFISKVNAGKSYEWHFPKWVIACEGPSKRILFGIPGHALTPLTL